MKPRPLRLFTCVWGDYLDLFENALVRSLSWPLNKSALEGATWDLCTKKADFQKANDIAKSVGINVELHEVPDEMTGDHPMMGAIILQIFKPRIQKCVETNSRMLLAPPDTIFGGDSIENILKIGEQKDTVVFVAHPRAHPTILEALNPSGSTGNGGLVTACWQHLHVSWREAEYFPNVGRLNSQVGGVLWRKLNEETMVVTHRLPTPYLINWTKEDLAYFNNAAVFGQIDHDWPAECVVNQERARYVGSSDAAFIVEITDANKNIPPLTQHSDIEPDKFWKNLSHNKHFRQMSVIFRKD